MYLIDTNIFLEILLNQDKKIICKKFLQKNLGLLYLTDFSLHSIGVILFRYKKVDIYQKFIRDITSKVGIISLPLRLYSNVGKVSMFHSRFPTLFPDRSRLHLEVLYFIVTLPLFPCRQENRLK
ncbi:MAG: VapC toxin family PIN domain ribonuclease [Firmicutes bacterium HGW-Firmicutes-13]|nr:MAG: VapC toxin family PIN domain ribonuclease [Firmicutes bacterium HGW-Firmicutes-13]